MLNSLVGTQAKTAETKPWQETVIGLLWIPLVSPGSIQPGMSLARKKSRLYPHPSSLPPIIFSPPTFRLIAYFSFLFFSFFVCRLYYACLSLSGAQLEFKTNTATRCAIVTCRNSNMFAEGCYVHEIISHSVYQVPPGYEESHSTVILARCAINSIIRRCGQSLPPSQLMCSSHKRLSFRVNRTLFQNHCHYKCCIKHWKE